MKYLLIIFLLVSCNPIGKNPGGMYTCSFEHVFAKVADTLWLKKVNDNYYKAERHSGIIYTNNKKKMIIEVWKLEFDKDAFTDIRTGKVMIWKGGELVFANRTYRKI